MQTNYNSWPFREATALLKRIDPASQTTVTFETGFGPSGLPHIGTFAEVARTTWVRHAFEYLSQRKTRLIAFSDDMDGLRKVPLNMPNASMLAKHLGKPLCNIPDPFGCCKSYSDHMNNKLKAFLDQYHFDYTFQSSTVAYHRGDFDRGLSIILDKVDEVRALILPTMREEKRKGWSPFFPICEKCGRNLTTRVIKTHPENASLTYICDQAIGDHPGCLHTTTTSVHGGKVKVGWKVDWALRWYSYDIQYEMYGKDLIESAQLSSKIVKLMGKRPPLGFFYEMFLDETGKKISKSIGKGLTVDTWVTYAPLESLAHYLFQNPKRARRLYWDVVPKSVDDYLDELSRYHVAPPEKKPDMAVWHIFQNDSNVPTYHSTINYSVISNLITALGADDKRLINDFLIRYDPKATRYKETIDALVNRALTFYRDIILPKKTYKSPTQEEIATLECLLNHLRAATSNPIPDSEKYYQTIPFAVAKECNIPPKALFQTFYEVVLGQSQGPRFGTLTTLLGRDRVIALLEKSLHL